MVRTLTASVAVVLMASFTACSNDDANATDDTIATDSAALPSDAFAGIAAAGQPVNIGIITNEGGQGVSQPENRQAVEAVTKYANENLGGIGGRPIELTICKSMEEPVSIRDCANKMVEAKVSALVVTSSGFGSIIAPIVTAAGIPYTSAMGGTAAETDADNTYIWTAGANTTQAMAAYAGNQGLKNVTAYAIENPAALGSLRELGVAAFKANGVNLKIVPIPLGTPDVTPQVSAGLDGNPDSVVILGESTVCTSVLKSLETLGSQVPKLVVQACASPEVVGAVGPALDDTYVFSSADTSSDDPESVLYRTILNRYAPGTPTSGYAVAGYQGMMSLVRATESVAGTDTSPAALSTAIKAAVDVPLPAGNGLTFACNGQAIPDFSSVCTNGIIVVTMKDGKQTDPQTVLIK